MGLGSKLRVVIDSTFQQELKFSSGVTLLQDTWLHPEQKTTLWGKVVYVPLRKYDCPTVENFGHCPQCYKAESLALIGKKGQYCDLSPKSVEEDIQEDDLICFSYDVIMDGELTEWAEPMII